jgi:4-hydroxythreonine-4-phosphate dehydrogenase
MWKSNNKIVGITMGDPAGIGPEVIAKALRQSFSKHVSFLLIGDQPTFLRYLKKLPPNVTICHTSAGGVKEGKPTAQGGKASLQFLETAVGLLKHGIIDAIATAPICKESIHPFHKNFHGHTEYLAEAFDIKQFDMMFVTPKLKTIIATRHVALKDVPGLITKNSVYSSIELAHRSIKTLFKVRQPRIAVLGLNPHAGEHGLMGKEDDRSITPAIAKAKANGIKAFGPFPADTFFAYGAKDYDCVIAMYHDQGLIPMKTLYYKEVVNLTVGLPFVRTSPAHGTAFDIAGKNLADPSSMRAAIELACQLV